MMNIATLKDKNIFRRIRDRFFIHFPSFKYRNFRLFFFGQVISVIGTWMQSTAQSWLVLQITNSPFKLGLLSAVQFLPALFLSLYAGVIIDKFSKKKILILTQSSLAILAFVLGLLVTLKVVQYYQILIIAFLSGLVNTIDMPARQSFYIELVDKEHLMNAISLNSSAFNLARIIGPGIAGILIGAVGYSLSFYLNAISFVPVIVAIFFVVERTIRPGRFSLRDLEHVNKDAIEGLKYILKIPIILIIFALFIVVNVFGLNFNVLVPTLVKQVFKLQSTDYGFLMSMMGVGALTGSLFLAVISYKGVKHFYLFGGALVLGLTLLLTGLFPNYYLTIAFTTLSGFSMVLFLNTANTLLQMESSEEFRGRVMSIYSLIFLGFTPFGALLTGTLSEKISVQFTYSLVGMIVTITTLIVYFLGYRRVFGREELHVRRVSGSYEGNFPKK
ncbi:MFS transporter [Caldisericum sp. AR60]|uniref:MFS transporter n=1 Tax=Caldisericum sp. AR60 TaxID=3397852 RepID=UPI0039FD8B18